MAGQMRNLNPGRNEKSRVVGYMLQVVFSCRAIPADKRIAVCALPSRRAKQDACHRSSLVIPHEVAKIFADGSAVSEIVLVGQQAVEHPRIV